MQRFDLTHKVALVTGGNGGIGAGIARGLLECGATVVIAGGNADKNAATVAALSTIGPPVCAAILDVTDEAQCGRQSPIPCACTGGWTSWSTMPGSEIPRRPTRWRWPTGTR